MEETYVVALGPVDVDEYYLCTTPLLPGAKCFVKKEEILPGGLVADAAGVMGTLGIKTYLFDTLGEDEYTDFLVDSLSGLNIDARYVDRLPGYQNLRTTIYLSEGERTVFIHENDKPPVQISGEMLVLLKNASFLYTTIYNLRELKEGRELAKELKASRTGIMVDVEPTTFRDREDEEDDFFFRMADLISFNQASYEKYCKGEELDFARKLSDDNNAVVMVTMGERGCRILAEGKEYWIPAYSVNAVDTTGAGDTHNGAFLYGYLKGWGIERAGKFAAAAAARAVTLKGAQAGAVSERTVMDFMRRLEDEGL